MHWVQEISSPSHGGIDPSEKFVKSHDHFHSPCGIDLKEWITTGNSKKNLVGGLEPWNFMFPYIGNFIIPTDELIFWKGVETTNQKWLKEGHLFRDVFLV